MSISIQLQEWQVLRPTECKELSGLSFDHLPHARQLAEQLSNTGMLSVAEYRAGIEIRATSYVGRIQLGELDITILPKIDFDILGSLFRYAYQLRNLQLIEVAKHNAAHTTFQDLLIQQLIFEIEHLLSRGIRREYQLTEDALASPRGRISIQQIAKQGGAISTTLPCRFYPRSDDNVLNQTLLAGLSLAIGMTTDILLHTNLRRLASMLSLTVIAAPLNANQLKNAKRAINRLTKAYQPSLQVIELLYFGNGPTWEVDVPKPLTLPGYLFDMNRFFETLVTRFLSDNLSGYQVSAQYGLHNFMSYDPKHNPLRRHSPTPRPDLAIVRNNQLVTLLDAKYRDLWEHPLPREMLYQLAIYALSQEHQRSATILYPTTSVDAKIQIITMNKALQKIPATISGDIAVAKVILRPINLASLNEAIWKSGPTANAHRQQLADHLVFGE